MNKIEKNYLQVPVNFIYILDRHCFHLMAVMLQKYSYWKNTGKLSEDDTFFMSLTELDDVLGNANQKDTRLTIEALYRFGLLRVESHNGKRNTTKFGINWKMIEDINTMSIQELKDSDLYIQKLPRTERITYCSTNCIQNVYKLYTNCTPTINNIDNIYNKNNINNNLNINNNILKEKENINIINNINIKEKEIEESVEDIIDLTVNTPRNIIFEEKEEIVVEKGKTLTPTTSNTPTEPSNPFKAPKEAIPDTLTHQVEQIPTPSLDALKSPKKRLYGRSSDYCSNLEDLGYRSDEWKYECPVPLEVMNW